MLIYSEVWRRWYIFELGFSLFFILFCRSVWNWVGLVAMVGKVDFNLVLIGKLVSGFKMLNKVILRV